MKLKRILTERQLRRFKTISLSFFGVFGLSYLTQSAVEMANADKMDGLQPFDGPFVWQNKGYALFDRRETDRGFVVEYEHELFCSR